MLTRSLELVPILIKQPQGFLSNGVALIKSSIASISEVNLVNHISRRGHVSSFSRRECSLTPPKMRLLAFS